MRLRLSVKVARGVAVVAVDGWLTASGVTELQRICSSLRKPLVLDLTNLRHADTSGAAALRWLVAKGARLTGASPYIELVLGLELTPSRSESSTPPATGEHGGKALRHHPPEGKGRRVSKRSKSPRGAGP